MHKNNGDGHHADNQNGDSPCCQTDGQEQAAEKFNQTSQEGKGRRQAEFGGKELSGGFKAISAKQSEQFLGTMGHQ
jgi:hypothetical protein